MTQMEMLTHAMMPSTFTLEGGSGEAKPVPASMSDALEFDDPEEALRLLAAASAAQAKQQAKELLADLETFSLDLPKVLLYNANSNNNNNNNNTNDDSSHHHHMMQTHPLPHATACADSIYGSLTKIAVGGSQASQEIRQLEQEKEAMEEEANCIATALSLRQSESQTNAAWQSRDIATAAKTIQPWLQWKLSNDWNDNTNNYNKSSIIELETLKKRKKRVVSYIGEYALEQLERIYQQLQQVLLQKYEEAVQKGNLESIGKYTPLLGKLQLEPKAVQLYVQFLKEDLNSKMDNETEDASNNSSTAAQQMVTFQSQMAKVYNTSVSALRHHLPMVSHCLHKADGDIAVVRLVHDHCSNQVLPLWRSYQRQRQLSSVRRHAERIADLYHSGEVDPESDVGFTTHIGSLSDVDSAMDEAATCIQHAESYLRFIQHTCNEVNRARQLRYEHHLAEQQQLQRSLEPQQQQQQQSPPQPPAPFKVVEILPPSTPLHEMVAEVGGQYVVIERCLLLASMHRAYAAEAHMEEARYFRPFTVRAGGSGSFATTSSMMRGGGGGGSGNSHSQQHQQPLQSILVETCFYAARRSTQRAFCTGHTGTASAMANFCVEALGQGFLDVLRQRAEDYGVALLKPGDGLLVGSMNYFASTAAIIGRQAVAPTNAAAGAKMTAEDTERRNQKIAQACALLNDIQVAAYHTDQLMTMLNESIARGFQPNTHGTEQLLLCVKQFTSTQEQFRLAADASVESLESILKPRIRAIVGEAVGSESSSSTFMVSPVMKQSTPSGGVGGGGSGGTTQRMNYNLDEEAYNFLQLSEGYMARLCSLLQELVEPLQRYLAPSLWDSLWLTIVGTTAKRLETLLRKSKFTALGALALDSDMRDFVSFTRDFLLSEQLSASAAAVTKACVPLGRLSQMAKVLNVDSVDDVLDVISSLKRKGNWDWKLDDAQGFLAQRFPEAKVKEVLRLQNQELG